MFFRISPIPVSLLMLASVLTSAVRSEESAELIKKIDALGSPLIGTRESSMSELAEEGADLLPLLAEARQEADPEMLWRLDFLERRLITGVSDESPADLRLIVDRFSDESPQQKAKLLNQLLEQGHWQPAFGLFIMECEADPGSEQRFFDQGLTALHNLVRKRLLEGERKQAEYFLGRAAEFSFGAPAYAAYLASTGGETAQLPPKIRLQYFLQTGDFNAALELAQRFGMQGHSERLQVVLGNSLPMVKAQAADQGLPEQQRKLAQWFLAEHDEADDVLSDWRSRIIDDAEEELLDTNRRDNSSALRALLLLTSIGEAEKARALMDARYDDFSQARYFELREDPVRMLANLGLDGAGEESIRRWYRDNDLFTFELNTFRIEQRSDLIIYFLLERGAHELVKELIDGSLKRIGEIDDLNEAKITLIQQLGNSMNFNRGLLNTRAASLHPLLYAYACEVLKDDPEASLVSLASSVLIPAAGLAAHVEFLDQLVVTAFPGIERAERLRRLLTLLRQALAPEETRLEWLGAVRQVAENQGEEAVDKLFTCLLEASDLASAWEMARDHPRLLHANSRPLIGRHLLVSQNWEALKGFELKASELDFGLLQGLRLQALLLEKVENKPQQAAKLRQQAHQLLLEDSNALAHYLDELYRFSRDDEAVGILLRAEVLGRRITMGEPPDQDRYLIESLIRSGKWKVAAAVAEKKLLELSANRSSIREYRNYAAFLISEAETLRNLLDFARGMGLFEAGRRREALALLERAVIREGVGTVGADLFFPILNRFPALRKASADWFHRVDQNFEVSLTFFPECAQTLNGRAWVAARAVRSLDMAEKSVRASLAKEPTSGAAMDTYAEVKFARGEREKALKRSRLALRLLPLDSSLRRQMRHFEKDPLPQK